MGVVTILPYRFVSKPILMVWSVIARPCLADGPIQWESMPLYCPTQPQLNSHLTGVREQKKIWKRGYAKINKNYKSLFQK